MSINLEYKDREKEKVGGMPTKLNEEENEGDTFLFEEQHENGKEMYKKVFFC